MSEIFPGVIPRNPRQQRHEGIGEGGKGSIGEGWRGEEDGSGREREGMVGAREGKMR
jgi:hypothetical protein